jgi:hypothetical protein
MPDDVPDCVPPDVITYRFRGCSSPLRPGCPACPSAATEACLSYVVGRQAGDEERGRVVTFTPSREQVLEAVDLLQGLKGHAEYVEETLRYWGIDRATGERQKEPSPSR